VKSKAPWPSHSDRSWLGCSASMRKRCWRRAVLILAAVLLLAVNVATRYCTVVGSQAGATRGVASQSVDAKRQHLLNDGLHWSAPAAKSVLFEPARVSSAVLPAAPPVPRFCSEPCLFTRPPPAY
jgi:hypothetical protein